MKKMLVSALGLGIAMSAQAGQLSYGYKDYFHFSTSTRPSMYIYNASTNADILMVLVGPRAFELLDKEQQERSSGYAHVTLSDGNSNWCVLDIKDGRWMWHPTVSASCSGINYMGISYDGSHSYTLHFD